MINKEKNQIMGFTLSFLIVISLPFLVLLGGDTGFMIWFTFVLASMLIINDPEEVQFLENKHHELLESVKIKN